MQGWRKSKRRRKNGKGREYKNRNKKVKRKEEEKKRKKKPDLKNEEKKDEKKKRKEGKECHEKEEEEKEEGGAPFVTSGLRLGTPAITTRGFGVEETRLLTGWIADILDDIGNEETIDRVRAAVLELCARFPVYD